VNPYKAAINLVQKLYDETEPGPYEVDKAVRELVVAELNATHEWITAEENGLTYQQILNAHEFPFEGGASGRRSCDACGNPAEVHMLVTRAETEETKEVYACKGHMLDPGPLLDW
jgi:hypothetical protein